MDYKKWIIRFFWIILVLSLCEACVFHSKNGHESESEGVRFIRVREDMAIGSDILTLKAYPRDSIIIKGVDRSTDHTFFQIKEVNDTTIQVLLNKTLDDLVDRDTPHNLLKFKIHCSSINGRNEDTSFLAVTVYVEDINDHTPTFLNVPYSVNIDETAPTGATIFHGISAFDRDKPNTPNSDIQYSLGPHEFMVGGPYFALESPHRPSLVLRRKLDYDEGVRIFDVPIIAADRGTPPRASNTTLRVFVKDSDDLPPKFSENVYRTKINEFSPLTGNPIRIPLFFNPPIFAADQDSLNATLSYDIISGNERRLFWVDPTSGAIFLDKEIDLEEESLPGNTFVLQLEARQENSPLKRAVSRVEIELMDLNDNPPEFEVDLYNISIVENLPSGFSVLQVNAIDRDQGENAEFYYQLSNEDPEGAFLIDPRTGWLTVRDQNVLDRETRSTITLNVGAIEKIEPYDVRDNEAGQVKVEITLLDSNDNTPVFDLGNLYEFKISVDAPIDHIVGFVTAKDPDEGRNGLILYELQRPRTTGNLPFKLDPHTGALSTTGPLSPGRVALFVEASDQPLNPSERRFSLAVVTIEIVRKPFIDKLDFIGAPYEFWVGANVPVGTSVGQIKTTIDWDNQGSVMFDLLHSYTEGVPFAVEERSGTVTVIRKLEEFERNVYEFEAVANYEHVLDRTISQKIEEELTRKLIRRTSKSEKQVTKDGDVLEIDEGTISDSKNVLVTNVTVHVVNPDDERGILMRGTTDDPIEFHVKENVAGALIGQLLYTNKTTVPVKTERKMSEKEKDDATIEEVFRTRNQRRSRHMMNSTKFKRNATSFGKPGNYRRRHRDANEETAFYVNVSPQIFIDDTINSDEEMIAEESSYSRASLPPPADFVSGRKKLRKNLVYENKLNNPSLFENFESRKEKKVRSTTVRTVSSRKFESRRTTRKEPISTTSIPELDITKDENRTSKQRIARQHNFGGVNPIPISDNETSISYVNQKKKQGGLRFLIANQQDVTEMITITNDGTLMTLEGLDREKRDVYRLTVIAEYSKGIISGAGIYQVTIYVDDVNDNPPVFNQNSYTGMISENSPLGTEVLLNNPIIVKDADVGINAEFTLSLHGEGSHLFALEHVNGTLNTNRTMIHPFDQFNGRINIEKSFANLQIMFMDAFDNMNNISHYVVRFIGPNILDRERENFYNLRLEARDTGGLSSEVKLGIFIADVNDNSPVFEKMAVFKDSGIEILEYTDEMEVYFVEQLIGDGNENSLIIKPDIEINKSPINYESVYYAEKGDRLNIGTPRFVGDTNSTLERGNKRVKGVASKKPKQMKKEKSAPLFAIFENIPVGMTVIKITATDEDYDANSQIFYEIVAESLIPNKINAPRNVQTAKYFGIDRLSGELKINRPLPAEAEIRLNITAKDIGGLTDFSILRFKIIDVNDHAPIFVKTWYTFDIDEGMYSGHVIGKIEANDEDFGQNGNVTYSIYGKERVPFVISPTNGLLRANGDLDREQKTIYEFKIMAADNGPGESKMFSLVEVEINILDLNDNAPEFINFDEIFDESSTKDSMRKLSVTDDDLQLSPGKLPVYKAYLNRRTEPGTLVKQITAIDKDFTGNGNGLVMYALNHHSLPYMFEIDSRDGIITTVSKFNKFNGYEHLNLTVVASDLGSPSMSSSALILINLQGEDIYDEEDDEMKPRMFDNKYYEIEVIENNVVPLVILKINTTNQEETYKWSIVSEMEIYPNSEFKIDPDNGTLWVTKVLDREMNDEFTLKIRADRVNREGRKLSKIMYPVGEDKMKGLMDNEVRIVVKVIDENDNSPVFQTNGRPIVAVIPNTANFGYPVTTVEAIDKDIAMNGKVMYTLLNEPSRLFGIDSATGRIRVLGPISKENQRIYGFDVKATDRNGDDDGKSAIANVFVYVLDENRQVCLVLSGRPVEIEQQTAMITKSLSDATGYDVRIRLLEPHSETELEPATDVYIYAVDPKTNSVVDMQELQEKMSLIDMKKISPTLPILQLPRLGGPRQYSTASHTINTSSITGSELAAIILAITVFVGGLATTLCIICVRNRRRSIRPLDPGLGYTVKQASSTLRTVSREGSRPRFYSERDREREYIDVPLPQSVINPAFNITEHDISCLRFNQLRNPVQITNLDTSVTSLHSSGRDSGLDMSRERSESPSRSQQNMLHRINGWNREKNKCICGQGNTNMCNEESSDSYEDSLKDIDIPRRTSLPRQPPGFRRPTSALPRGVRHSFSGVRDDLTQSSPALMSRSRFNGVRNASIADLEERLRHLGITFHEPFVLNNSRC